MSSYLVIGHKLLRHSLKGSGISLQLKGHDHVNPNRVLHFQAIRKKRFNEPLLVWGLRYIIVLYTNNNSKLLNRELFEPLLAAFDLLIVLISHLQYGKFYFTI